MSSAHQMPLHSTVTSSGQMSRSHKGLFVQAMPGTGSEMPATLIKRFLSLVQLGCKLQVHGASVVERKVLGASQGGKLSLSECSGRHVTWRLFSLSFNKKVGWFFTLENVGSWQLFPALPSESTEGGTERSEIAPLFIYSEQCRGARLCVAGQQRPCCFFSSSRTNRMKLPIKSKSIL